MSRSRRPLRITLTASLTVIALIAATLAVLLVRIPRDQVTALAPSSLVIPDEFRGTHTSGDLRLSLTAEPESQVTIEADGRTVWQSPAGLAFLGGGIGSFSAREDRGYFWPNIKHERTWTSQEIQAVNSSPTQITMSGILFDGEEAGPHWSATFTLTPHGVELAANIADGTSIALWSARSAGAAVHGFGEQFTDFNLDGKLLPILVREQGVGRGEQPLTLLADLTNNGAGGTEEMTYAAWATWVTSDLQGLRLDPALPESHAPALADLRTPDQIGLELQATQLRARLTAADSPVELVARQQAQTTRPALADWASEGAIVGIQGGSTKVREVVADLQAAGTKISGVWLQDWTGGRTTSFGDRLWWTWQLDSSRYPDWAELVAELANADIAVTTYVNPFVVEPADSATGRNLFAEAREQGFLVLDSAGAPYALDQGGFDAYLVDLTDSGARAWFAQVIAEEVLADGVRGFMADFAEGLPFDAVLSDGDPLLAHNAWPSLWAEVVAEACDLAAQPDCVRWFRTGSLGMDEHSPLFWNGDQLVSFGAEDGLASVLSATFSAGVSGWPLVHSDIGGYTSINAVVKDYVRSPDLLARWAEFAAFGVVMRTHEGNRPAENLQVYSDEQTRKSFARATQIFGALGDYRAEVITEATLTGVPAIRPGWLVVPGTAAAEATEQFFLGEALLVAPVLHEGATSVDVSLPPGKWRHLFTGEEFDGDQRITVAAPLGTPAAFVDTANPWAQRLVEAIEAAGLSASSHP